MRAIRTAGIAILLILIAAACGQKEGVNQQVAVGGGGGGGGGGISAGEDGVVDEGGAIDDGTGGGGADPGGGETTGGTDSGGAGTSGGGGETAGGGGTSGGGTTSGGSSGPGNRTGITAKEIIVGVHAPVTGAAPFPQSTFERGKEIYWDWLKDAKGGVFGRDVRIVFRDDGYNPSRAVQVCREMAEKEKAFVLVGGGGADQITACAQYANQAGIPYFSAGVNESGLATLKTYFALSQTYSQQSPTLASYAKKKLQTKKLGVVSSDTRSFADGHNSMVESAKKAGIEVVAQEKIKTGSQGETLQIVQNLRNAGADTVYILTSPTIYIQMANQAQTQAFNPFWIGPGITKGLNVVTTAGCPAVGKGKFLSPFPQLDVIDQMDPNYRPAYRKYGGAEADDIGIALWGLNKTLHAIFEAAGKDMSRESVISTLNSGKRIETGVFPTLQYAPGKHFGATTAHMLEADCGSRPGRYITTARFVTGF